MKDKKLRLTVTSENLAVPEIHTSEADAAKNDDNDTPGILYENLAIPEIHFKRSKKNDKKD